MILLTGANGHLGANPLRRLLADGAAVRVLLGCPTCRLRVMLSPRCTLPVVQLNRGSTGDIPWYDPFFPHRWEWETFRSSGRGRKVTNTLASILERLRIESKGTGVVARDLDVCPPTCWRGGGAGIFTPAYFILGRKPQG